MNRLLRITILLLAFFTIVYAFTSCISEKKRLEICKNCPIKIERHDSIIEKLVPYPVTLPPVPGPTLYIANPCEKFCNEDGTLKPFYVEKKENGIKTSVSSDPKNNTFNITSNLEDSTKATVPVKQKEIHTKVTKDVPSSCDKDHLKWFDPVCRWFTLIGLLLGLGAFLWKFRKVLFV